MDYYHNMKHKHYLDVEKRLKKLLKIEFYLLRSKKKVKYFIINGSQKN